MQLVGAASTSHPRLLEQPGRISLLFEHLPLGAAIRCRNLELGLPFRSPPRAALADVGKLRPILGNLLQLEVVLAGEGISGWLAHRGRASADQLQLELLPQGALLRGEIGSSGGPAFSVRLVVRQGEQGLALEPQEARLYGVRDRPAAQLVHELLQELLDGLPCRLDEVGLCVWPDPVQPLLLHALAAEGWKIPLRSNIRLSQLKPGFGELSLRFARSTGEEAAAQLPPQRELTQRLRTAEVHLLRGELERAVPLWLAELKEKSQIAWCTDRLAQAVAAQPELFAQPEKVLDSFFRARPDFPAGLLAAASLALRRGEHQAAAERYEALARLPGGFRSERVLALTAAGQAMAGVDPQRAAIYFEEALLRCRDHRAALAGLAALPAASGSRVLIQRTRRLVACEEDAAAASTMHTAIGQLLLAERSEPDGARRHFERALGLEPGRIEAAIGLAHALIAGGNGERGLALLAYLVEHLLAVGMVQEAAQLLSRRAQLALALPGFEDAARTSYRRVLDLFPGHAEARAALAALDAPSIPAPPGKRLAERVSKPPTEGLVTQVVRLSLAMDGQEVAAPQLRGQLESALAAVRDWPAFLEELRTRVRSVTDLDLKIRILLQGGEICELRLDDPLQAEEWYGQVLQLDPDQPQALDALIRLLGKREAWPRLVEMLLKRAGHAQDTDHWAELLLSCADVLARHMGEQGRAVSVLEAILAALPEHRVARSLLATSLEAAQRHEEALEQLELLEEGCEGKALLALLERKAQILLVPLQRTKEGIQQLVRLLKIDPDHEGALATLDELYQERGNPKMELAVIERRLANLYQKGQGGDEERILRSNLFLRRGRLRGALRGAEEAEGVRRDFEMALREWRENAEAAEELLQVYRRERNTAGLLRVIPLLLEMMLQGPARERLESELATLQS
ncbi:MAG: hypothetical protein FJ125_00620 [Deltaproteobacteria bacterium]|nr:hypothetical protein [Deltaproteobacteria bacterium]